VTLDLISAMASEDAGLITIYWGQDVEQGEVDELASQLERQHPDYEVEIHYGGNPFIITSFQWNRRGGQNGTDQSGDRFHSGSF